MADSGSLQDVEYLARLSRIAVDAEMEACLRKDMGSIEAMVDVLRQTDISDAIEPMAHPSGVVQRMRDDIRTTEDVCAVVQQSPGYRTADIPVDMDSEPAEAGFFTTPKVIG